MENGRMPPRRLNLLPSPSEYPPGRLFSLDLLRGIDMFYLAVVSTILLPLFRALGVDPRWETFFCTHPWEGFTLYDLIMPLFIFMCGAAVPLALGRRLVDGVPGAGYWRHVWSRVGSSAVRRLSFLRWSMDAGGEVRWLRDCGLCSCHRASSVESRKCLMMTFTAGFGNGLRIAEPAREYYQMIVKFRQKSEDASEGCVVAEKKTVANT